MKKGFANSIHEVIYVRAQCSSVAISDNYNFNSGQLTVDNGQQKPTIVFSVLTINCQLSTVNYQLSTINCQLSTVNYQLSTINYQLSTINYQLSTI
jgi:hypothetical protein